jgi:hypothetical protein
MRILASTQGPYGERIVKNIEAHIPSGWTIRELRLPKSLPPFIEEPEDFLLTEIPEADLLLAMGESPGAAQLVTDIAQSSHAKSVIAPIDNSAWMPQGLANQIKQELGKMGIASVFPRPFCSLTGNTTGYGSSTQEYHDATIRDFASHFGSPRFRIHVDPETKTIDRVEVERNSACGSAYHVAKGLLSMSADEAKVKAGLILHHYPCLCSMNTEWIDDRLNDTLMHVSGYIVNEHVTEQLKPYLTPPQYLKPDEYVE